MNATSWIESSAEIVTPRARRLRAAANGGVVASVLLILASVGGLAMPEAYAREAPSWAVQGIAQDWFDMLVAGPALLIAALAAWRGSRRGQLVLGGFLLYTVYTFVIYAFAVHLNALFLVYCAGLGVALFSLIALARSLGPSEELLAWDSRIPRRSAGSYLVLVGLAFGALWLSQLVPAVIHGTTPPELSETGLFTNPIHVLDLAFVLPLHVVAGVWLWRRRALGVVLAAVVLAFGVLMAASIGVLVVMMDMFGVGGGGVAVAVVMGGVSMGALGLLVRLVRAIPD